MGGGVALIDLDGDSRLDLFFCNGGPIDKKQTEDPPAASIAIAEICTSRRITKHAKAPGPSYAMGSAVGDFDNDGRDDLFVSGWRDQRLYRNVGGRLRGCDHEGRV